VSGPIAATADDLALAYYAMAGRDEEDLNTYHQPLPTLTGLYNTEDLSDLKIGIYPAWNEEVYNPAITESLNGFIERLRQLGAEIIEIDDIPDLKEVGLALFVTAGSELLVPLKQYKKDFHKFNCNTRYNAYPLEYITTTVSY
jgi:Asp-tRNA(Asn)/Glu-tRNA(Gln) amidotransferase A subunit family amidase